MEVSEYLEEMLNRLFLEVENLNEMDVIGVLKRLTQ